MSFEQVKNDIPDFGKDIRLNLDSVLSEDGAPGLTPQQLWGAALACVYSLESHHLLEPVLKKAEGLMDDAYKNGARAAATIMAMNNVYYRSMHLIGDDALTKLPARLRMNVIGNPGIPKVDFEVMSLAVSALAGCGQCLVSHRNELKKAGIEDIGVQSALRIASVIKAADQALRISPM